MTRRRGSRARSRVRLRHTSHGLRSEPTPSTRSGSHCREARHRHRLTDQGAPLLLDVPPTPPHRHTRGDDPRARNSEGGRARPPRNERRSLIEVATQGLFDLFGFEVGGRCRRAARPRSGSCTYRDSAIPRFRSSATFASVASTRRSPSRRPTLDENDRRSLLPPAASSSNSLRDVRPAVRVRQPHAGRGEQAELRRGLRVTVQASNGHRKTRRERARRTPLSQPRGSASSQLVKRESA